MILEYSFEIELAVRRNCNPVANSDTETLSVGMR